MGKTVNNYILKLIRVENMGIKDKLNKLAELEKKHGVLGISLNPSDSSNAEAVLDFAAEIIEDSSQIIKNKSKLKKI